MTGVSAESECPAVATAVPEVETTLAGRVQEMVAAGDHAEAREVFGQIVGRQQRRS
jgi:hypothetical protein